MKKLTLVVLLCLMSSISANSIGRPHNIFTTYKMLSEHSTPKPILKTPQKPEITNIEKSKERVLKSISVAQKVVSVFQRFF